MEGKAVVSVVVPIYNQRNYLHISIPTVLNQTYPNLEIILVNDGSTDGSEKILEYYKELDKRVRVITKENGGLVDATLRGIEEATGDYICFLDPDDKWGKDFVELFINEMEGNIDFVAAGFYYDNGGSLRPFELRENKIYTRNEIVSLMKNYLIDEQKIGISNKIFISRWNKLYRSDLVKKVAEEFKNCKEVTLGEDSIFTFLVLKNSKGAKTVKKVNTYYYNVGNQNSMMKSGTSKLYLDKCDTMYATFKALLERANLPENQALALYFFEINILFQRLLKQSKKEFCNLYKIISKKQHYKSSTRYMLKNISNKSQKLQLAIRLYCDNPTIYWFVYKCKSGMKKLVYR